MSSRPRDSFLAPSSKDTKPQGVVDVSLVVASRSVGLLGQSSSLVDEWKGWLYELTEGQSYQVRLLRLGGDSLETLYDGTSSTPTFRREVKADGYYIFEVTSPDGQVSEGILSPAFGDKTATVVLDRTSTVAARILRKIYDKSRAGDTEAGRALASYLLSPAQLYTAAYASLLVVDEQARRAVSGREMSIEQMADAILEKLGDTFDGVGLSATSYALAESEAAYSQLYTAKGSYPSFLMAYRTPQTTDVDVAAQALTGYPVVTAAFNLASNILRPVGLTSALAGAPKIPDLFKDIFETCVASGQTYTCPDQSLTQAPSTQGSEQYKQASLDLLSGVVSTQTSGGGPVTVSQDPATGTQTTSFSSGTFVNLPAAKTVSFGGCDFTVSSWIRLRKAPSALKVSTLVDSTATPNASTFRFYIDSELRLVFERHLLDGSKWLTRSEPDAISLNDWLLVAVERDGSKIKFLKNGEQLPYDTTLADDGKTSPTGDMPIKVVQELMNSAPTAWSIGATPSDPLNSSYMGDMQALEAKSCPVRTLASPVILVNGSILESGKLIPQNQEGGNAIKITISHPDPQATVTYTEGGQEPSTTSAAYDQGNPPALDYNVAKNYVFKSKAFKTGWYSSPSVTASFTITPPIGSTTSSKFLELSPPPAFYEESQQVTLSNISAFTDLTFKYQLTDDITDDNSSSYTCDARQGSWLTYSEAITINKESRLCIKATHPDYPDSNALSFYYDIKGKVATPTINVIGAQCQDASDGLLCYDKPNIELKTDTINSAIYYSLDGSEPSSTSLKYAGGPFTLHQDATLRVVAIRQNWDTSDEATKTVRITGTVADPTATPPGGYHLGAFGVTFQSSTPGSVTEYSENGGLTWTDATGEIFIGSDRKFKIRSKKTDWETSKEIEVTYNFPGTAFDASFLPTSKVFYDTDTVDITPVDPDTSDWVDASQFTVYCTTNGDTPTPDPAHLCPSSVTVDRDMTIKAIVARSNWVTSEVRSESYTMQVDELNFKDSGGEKASSQTVTISTPQTNGSTIHYTLDGNQPSPGNSLSGLSPLSLEISKNTTVTAIATKPNYQSSGPRAETYTFKVADVTFTPDQKLQPDVTPVTLNSLTPGHSIYYTTDGSVPSTSSSLYTSPIILDRKTTIKAMATRSDFASSTVSEATYDIKVDTPTMTPDPDQQPEPFNQLTQVTLRSENTPNAVIYYTLDGSIPTISSTRYTGVPIPLQAPTTVRAIATRDDFTPSDVVTKNFRFRAAKPQATSLDGDSQGNFPQFFDKPQTVTLSTTTDGAKIYYTVDGKNPDKNNSPQYVSPIVITENTPVKAIAIKDGWEESEELSLDYIIKITTCTDPVYACLVGEWVCGAVTTSSPVTKPICDSIGFNYEGTTDTSGLCGQAQCASSCQEYYGRLSVQGVQVTPFLIAETCPLSVVSAASRTASQAACQQLQDDNPELSIMWDVLIESSCTTTSGGATFKTPGLNNRTALRPVAAPAPRPSYESGTYTTPIDVELLSENFTSLSNSDATKKIYYTTDGSPPTSKSKTYTGPIRISSSQTVKAIAIQVGVATPKTMTASYNITGKVKPPTFSPAPGGYGPAQAVSITSSDVGASIRYTLDGSTPTKDSATYTGPISVSATTTIKAVAIKTNWDDSNSSEATFTINGAAATPTALVAAGTYSSAQSVTLSTATVGATIYYTTNGDSPTTSSAIYSAPISVTATQTIKAIATKADHIASGEASFQYTISAPQPIYKHSFTKAIAGGAQSSISASNISGGVIEAGDTLVAVVMTRSDVTSVSPGAWTRLGSSSGFQRAYFQRVSVYYKTATGDPAVDNVVSVSQVLSARIILSVLVFRGQVEPRDIQSGAAASDCDRAVMPAIATLGALEVPVYTYTNAFTYTHGSGELAAEVATFFNQSDQTDVGLLKDAPAGDNRMTVAVGAMGSDSKITSANFNSCASGVGVAQQAMRFVVSKKSTDKIDFTSVATANNIFTYGPDTSLSIINSSDLRVTSTRLDGDVSIQYQRVNSENSILTGMEIQFKHNINPSYSSPHFYLYFKPLNGSQNNFSIMAIYYPRFAALGDFWGDYNNLVYYVTTPSGQWSTRANTSVPILGSSASPYNIKVTKEIGSKICQISVNGQVLSISNDLLQDSYISGFHIAPLMMWYNTSYQFDLDYVSFTSSN